MAYNNAINDLQQKKEDNQQIYKDLENKNGEIDNLKQKYNNEIKLLKNEISNLKKRENVYKESLSRLKTYNTTIDNNNNNNLINQRLNMSNIVNNNQFNKSPQVNVNTSYMTYNPQRNNELNISGLDKDDSFRYSYYLIDNLKNAINKVDFENEYTNLL